jgi:hypothetical protein
MACIVLLMLLVMVLQEILEHLDRRCEDQICWSFLQSVHSALRYFLVVVTIAVRLGTRSQLPSSEHCCNDICFGILLL